MSDWTHVFQSTRLFSVTESSLVLNWFSRNLRKSSSKACIEKLMFYSHSGSRRWFSLGPIKNSHFHCERNKTLQGLNSTSSSRSASKHRERSPRGVRDARVLRILFDQFEKIFLYNNWVKVSKFTKNELKSYKNNSKTILKMIINAYNQLYKRPRTQIF